GAESYQMLLERVKPWFDALDRPTVCVTHGGVVRALFRMVLGMPEKEAANLNVPQDRLLRLEGRTLEWL
ncbi:MAG: histidine phosphatase family protein, partial [Mesorhizobium sp.]